MSLAPVIAELIAAGVTGDALVAAVARIEAAQKPVRTAGAERQARYRARLAEKKANVTSDVTDVTDVTQKEKSPIPPKEKTTPISNEIGKYQAREADFQKFWRAYPRRTGSNPKDPARKSWLAAIKRGTNPDEIISGALAYAAFRSEDDPKFTKQAATWLNQRGWEDDYTGLRPSARAGPAPPRDALTAMLSDHIRGQTHEPDNRPIIEINPVNPGASEPGSGEGFGDPVQRGDQWQSPALRQLVATAVKRA